MGGLSLFLILTAHSSNGTWVNFKKIQNGAIELKTGDIIHFMDPKLYNEAANPTYKFVKPKTSTTRARAVEDLYVLKSRIAEGTYGVVQLAECKRTKRRVAIKLIRNSMCHGRKKLRDAFLKEISVCMSMPVHVNLFYARNHKEKKIGLLYVYSRVLYKSAKFMSKMTSCILLWNSKSPLPLMIIKFGY